MSETSKDHAIAHAKYKVGDLVICTNVDGLIEEPGVGSVNVITSIKDGDWKIHAYDLNNKVYCAYNLSEIRKFNSINDAHLLSFLEDL